MNVLNNNNSALNLSNPYIIAWIIKAFMETDLNNLYNDLYGYFGGMLLKQYPSSCSPKHALRIMYKKPLDDPFALSDIFNIILSSFYVGVVDDDEISEALAYISQMNKDYPDKRSSPRNYSLEYYEMFHFITVDDYFKFLEKVTGERKEREIRDSVYEFADIIKPEFKSGYHSAGEPLYLGEVLAMADSVLNKKMWAEITLGIEEWDDYMWLYKKAIRAMIDILIYPYDDCFIPAPCLTFMDEFSKYILSPEEFDDFLTRTNGGTAK